MNKIYINARFFAQNMTGVQRFAMELSKSLSKFNKDIIFLAPASIDMSLVPESFNIKIIGKRNGLYWEQIELPNFLKKQNNPLLVNLCNRSPLFYKNNVLVLHDITFIRYPKSFSKSFLLLYYFLIPKLLNKAKKILTVSDFSKKEISEYYKININDIDVIYNAVSKDFFSRQKEYSPDKYLLAVSSDVYNKNFERLVLAFNKINKNLNIKLKVVGKEGIIAKKYSNSNSNIEFVGRVSDSELVKLYQNALAFVFPSIYEGFGIPPIEAQACGCPVLSSCLTAMPEILSDSVYYFNPLDIDDIANKMESIVEDEVTRENLIIAGFLNIKKFSWDLSARKLLDIIEKIKS